MTEQQREHLFFIETCSKVIAFASENEDADLGNREILYKILTDQIENSTLEALKG